MKILTHGSLFSGIGGAELAADWAGWENVFHCEINPFGQKILNHYWPNSISYHDITKTDFTIHRGTIDILSGGFPCQPYSTAGKRKGKNDERHLWPEMLRAIREIQPRWVVGENVRGFIDWNGGLVFDEVQNELEAEGFEVIPFLLPAISVNAPHRRDRIFIVSHSNSYGRFRIQEPEKRFENHRNGISCNDINTFFNNGTIADTMLNGLQGGIFSGKDKTEGRENENRHAEKCLPDYRGKLSFRNFPTQSPICGGNDGVPSELDGITFSEHKKESIKAYGNAIVPQLIYQIFKAINDFENLNY